jgi:hypothetical protein
VEGSAERESAEEQARQDAGDSDKKAFKHRRFCRGYCSIYCAKYFEKPMAKRERMECPIQRLALENFGFLDLTLRRVREIYRSIYLYDYETILVLFFIGL